MNDTHIMPQLKSALLITNEPELDALLNECAQKTPIEHTKETEENDKSQPSP